MRTRIAIIAAGMVSLALAGCGLGGEARLEVSRSGLCNSGTLGLAINSTGQVPEGCVRIEGGQIGALPLTINIEGAVITITGWTDKDGEPDEKVGFTFTSSGGSVAYAVKAGGRTFAADSSQWVHPAGTGGSEASGISNITFCPDDGGGGGGSGGGSGGSGGGSGGGGGGGGEECDPPGGGGGSGGGSGSGSPDGGSGSGDADGGSGSGGGGSGDADGGSGSGGGGSGDPDGGSGSGGGTANGPLPRGEFCSLGTECFSGRCTAGLCEGSGAGEPCRTMSDCEAGLACSAGLCIPLVN